LPVIISHRSKCIQPLICRETRRLDPLGRAAGRILVACWFVLEPGSSRPTQACRQTRRHFLIFRDIRLLDPLGRAAGRILVACWFVLEPGSSRPTQACRLTRRHFLIFRDIRLLDPLAVPLVAYWSLAGSCSSPVRRDQQGHGGRGGLHPFPISILKSEISDLLFVPSPPGEG